MEMPEGWNKLYDMAQKWENGIFVLKSLKLMDEMAETLDAIALEKARVGLKNEFQLPENFYGVLKRFQEWK